MPPQKASRPWEQRRDSYLAASVHAFLIAAFSAVWLWHLTPEANKQEVAKKKGWFFEYYTFAGFTLQLIQFAIAFASDVSKKAWLIRLADDVSCAAVPVVAFITAFYYCLLLSGNIVDSDEVPSWVSPALHTGNFAGMLADLVVCQRQRTFRKSASILSAAMNFAYMAFLYSTSQLDGCYPYAFLESTPEPFGIILTAAILVLGVEGLFLVARRLNNTVS